MSITNDDKTIIRSERREQLSYEFYAEFVRASKFPKASGVSDGCTITPPPPVLKIPRFYQFVNELNHTIQQIVVIINGEVSDDDGILRPTQYAIDRVSSLLIDACNAFLYEATSNTIVFPKARVSPDLGGGLRIEWSLRSGTVKLVVPATKTEKEYLYQRIGGASKTVFALSGPLIAGWLKKVL